MAIPEALRRPLRSGAFRAAASAVAIFLLVAGAIATLLYNDASAALTREVVTSLEAEAAAILSVSVEGDAGGANAVTRAVAERSARGQGGLYLLRDSDDVRLAGNLAALPKELVGRTGGGVFRYAPSSASSSSSQSRQAVAILTRTPDGGTLLLGRDVDEQRQTLARMRMTGFAGLTLLALIGLAGGYAVARNVLARVEAVNATARSIMAGDMRQRIALAGVGDEIDALSANINHMLDRIEQLMCGLREVSDNIAHDLKTPLNRLRNRAEASLREAASVETLRDGLERTIEEADDLIKVFNALLLIARLEAGALEGTTEVFDAGALVGDVAELYEPVAEEAGLALNLSIRGDATIEANKHLVGQAVANLIDNAIKYSAADATVSGAARGHRATQVSVELATSPTEIAISVADDGPGIGAADRERVLQRFVRLEQSRSRPGTGLGLSLVAAVARLHHGALRLEDNAPGLRVVLVLPKAARGMLS